MSRFSRLVSGTLATGSVATLIACAGPHVVTTPRPIPVPAATPVPAASIDLTKPPTLGAPPSLTPPRISTRVVWAAVIRFPLTAAVILSLGADLQCAL